MIIFPARLAQRLVPSGLNNATLEAAESLLQLLFMNSQS